MDELKKKIRNTLLIGSALMTPVVANKVVYETAGKKYMMYEALHSYEWRLGKIGYSVKGAGKPVVLIHGFETGSSSAVWANNFAALAEKYKVYTLDLLGYGSSDRVNTTYTAYTYASLINDFIIDVVKKPAAVIAEGGGAMFAAAAYEKDPTNFRKLIFICPRGIDEKFADNYDKKKRALFELPVIGDSVYLANTAEAPMKALVSTLIDSPAKQKFLLQRFYSSAHNGGFNNRYVYASLRTNFMNIDIKPFIGKINIPLLIVWGENADDVKNMEKLQTMTDKAEFVLFEETKKLPQYENPEEFNELVKEFFK